MKRVLVFGAAGFVGSYLAKEFVQNGYEVYGSDRQVVESLRGFSKYMAADILDYDAVAAVITELMPDYIVNLAAVSSVGISWNSTQVTMEVNVIGALNILEASRELECLPKVMFIGSSEEYAPADIPINESMPLNANNPYGISKMAQERFADIYRERYGMKIYCVRPFNHTGVSSNKKYMHGYETQIEEYAKAEGTRNRIYVLVDVGNSNRVDQLRKRHEEDVSMGKDVADLVIIDAKSKDSASIYYAD